MPSILKIEIFKKLGKVAGEAVKAVVAGRDLTPCKARVVRIRTTPGAVFRRCKVLVHIKKNGRFTIKPLDPV